MPTLMAFDSFMLKQACSADLCWSAVAGDVQRLKPLQLAVCRLSVI